MCRSGSTVVMGVSFRSLRKKPDARFPEEFYGPKATAVQDVLRTLLRSVGDQEEPRVSSTVRRKRRDSMSKRIDMLMEMLEKKSSI